MKRGHKIQVVCYQPLNTPVRGSPYETSEGMEVRRISWFSNQLFYKLERSPLAEFAYLTPMIFWFTTLLLLRPRRRPDVIHAHGLSAVPAAVLLGKIFKIRVVVSLHVIYRLANRHRTFSKPAAFLLSKPSKILVPSSSAKRDLQGAGVPGAKISIYTYWVDQKIFKPAEKEECRKMVGLRPKGFVVLFVGRLIGGKWVTPLVSVAKKMHDHTFLFVGEGPLKGALEKAATECPNVVFMGRKDGRELSRIYNCADILWGTADEDYVGRVVIEALSCGIPVMIPDRLTVFGIERKVSSNILGPSVSILVKPFPEEIETELRKLSENRSIVEAMSRRSRETALTSYSDDNATVIEKSYLGD
jgi:glycosyltransferase involved in cell wall biosynthesis